MEYKFTRKYTGKTDAVGAVYYFPGLGSTILISCLDGDYGYCYQGAVFSFGGMIYYGGYWGPMGEAEDEYEEVFIDLDKQVWIKDNNYYVQGEEHPRGYLDGHCNC